MESKTWYLHVDGASKGNPGLAGAGICLSDKVNVFIKCGAFLGIKTNNQAEYFGLLLGLMYAKHHLGDQDQLLIYADSELLVKQILGKYAVKNPSLRCLYVHARIILDKLKYKISHVYREQNTIADKCANIAIEKREKVPDNFLSEWLKYEHCI